MPGEFESILTKLQGKLGKQTIKRASTINRPRPKREVQQINIFNEFNRRNPKADGGSVNGSEQAAFRAKVEELMDDGYDFGEAVREAMRQGYKKGGKARLSSSVKKQTLYNKLFKELPKGYLEDYKKIFLNDRGDGTFSRKPGDKGGIEIMEKKYGDTIKGIKTRQGNIKNVPRKIGEFNSAILQNLQKENKIVSGLKDAKEIRKADLKILGTFSPAAPKGMTTHHFMPLAGIEGESLNLSSTKNTAFISSKLNSKMSPYDKKLKANQKEQIELLKKKPEGWKNRLNQLNFKAKKIYKEAGKKVPGSKGYLGYSQIILKPDGSYDIKVTGIDSNKSISGLKGKEIFYKDIEKGDNRAKVKKLTETYIKRNKLPTPKIKQGLESKILKNAGKVLSGASKVAKPLSLVVGPYAVMSAAAKADDMDIKLGLGDQAAAFLMGDPQAAIDMYKMRNDPEYAQQVRAANYARPLDEGTYDAIDESFTSYFDGGIVSVLKGVK